MTQANERPVALTALVVVGLVTVMVAFVARMSHPVPPWQFVSQAIGTFAILAAFVGIWHMRRWGVRLYAGAVTMNVAILATAGIPRWPHFAVPALILAILAYYWRKMK